MPTERFYRLSEEKRLAICNAAIREFVRVPFEKASINRMIQDAEISRGSFYTYFEDKLDILLLILRNMNEQMRKICEESLKKNQGDFWQMTEDLLEYTLHYCENQKIHCLFKNTMPFHRNMGFGGKMYETEGGARDEYTKALYEATDITSLKVENLEEYQMLLDMCAANMMVAVARYFQNPDDTETIRAVFRKKMNLLRYGASQHS